MTDQNGNTVVSWANRTSSKTAETPDLNSADGLIALYNHVINSLNLSDHPALQAHYQNRTHNQATHWQGLSEYEKGNITAAFNSQRKDFKESDKTFQASYLNVKLVEQLHAWLPHHGDTQAEHAHQQLFANMDSGSLNPLMDAYSKLAPVIRNMHDGNWATNTLAHLVDSAQDGTKKNRAERNLKNLHQTIAAGQTKKANEALQAFTDATHELKNNLSNRDLGDNHPHTEELRLLGVMTTITDAMAALVNYQEKALQPQTGRG